MLCLGQDGDGLSNMYLHVEVLYDLRYNPLNNIKKV